MHVCPTGASHIRKEDGIVDVNPDLASAACAVWPPAPIRCALSTLTKVADKCDFLPQDQPGGGQGAGLRGIPCPTKALVFGNLDDPDSPIAKRLVKETTYRCKQALGTSPKMYRVPKGR